jgi:hypothetical protein
VKRGGQRDERGDGVARIKPNSPQVRGAEQADRATGREEETRGLALEAVIDRQRAVRVDVAEQPLPGGSAELVAGEQPGRDGVATAERREGQGGRDESRTGHAEIVAAGCDGSGQQRAERHLAVREVRGVRGVREDVERVGEGGWKVADTADGRSAGVPMICPAVG